MVTGGSGASEKTMGAGGGSGGRGQHRTCTGGTSDLGGNVTTGSLAPISSQQTEHAGMVRSDKRFAHEQKPASARVTAALHLDEAVLSNDVALGCNPPARQTGQWRSVSGSGASRVGMPGHPSRAGRTCGRAAGGQPYQPRGRWPRTCLLVGSRSSGVTCSAAGTQALPRSGPAASETRLSGARRPSSRRSS